MLIVMEGLEGVGKTTLSEFASNELSIDYIKTPPVFLNEVRQVVANWESDKARFYFYLSSLISIQNELEPYSRSLNQHIIVDRYVASTIAYHAKGRHFIPPDFDGQCVLDADLTINVICSSEERKRRLGERGFHIFERPEFDDENIDRYFREISDFSFCNSASISSSTKDLYQRLLTWLSEQK